MASKSSALEQITVLRQQISDLESQALIDLKQKRLAIMQDIAALDREIKELTGKATPDSDTPRQRIPKSIYLPAIERALSKIMWLTKEQIVEKSGQKAFTVGQVLNSDLAPKVESRSDPEHAGRGTAPKQYRLKV